MYHRCIIILNFPNFYPSKIDYKSCFKNHRALWDLSTTLRYATFRSRWRVGGFLLLTSMTWNILFFTIFYILFNFIYLSRLAIKRRYFPYTSSRLKWVKRMKWRDLILMLVYKHKWMYRRYIRYKHLIVFNLFTN